MFLNFAPILGLAVITLLYTQIFPTLRFNMATATPTTAPVPAFKEEKYERIVLEANPQQEQEIEQAKGRVSHVLI